jgi:tetratricopeptide (TPR) repeat protein|tara:strand:+ start:765 stop:1718 length:954 start_codon:yes stop_codon:yes gene_type:complete
MAVLEQIILEIGPHPENLILTGARENITLGNYNQAIADLAPILANPNFIFNGMPFTRAQTDDAQVLTYTAEYKQLNNNNDSEGAINKILEAKEYAEINMPQRKKTLNTLFDLEHAAIYIDQDVRDRARDVLAGVDDRAAGGEKIYMIGTLDFRDGEYVRALAGFERLYGMNSQRPGLKNPLPGETFEDTSIGKTLSVLSDPAITMQLPDFTGIDQAIIDKYNYAEGRFRHGAVTEALGIFNEVKGQVGRTGRNPFKRTDPNYDAKKAMEAKIVHWEAMADILGRQPQTALQKLRQANQIMESPKAYETMSQVYQNMP